jgi:GTP-binding protein EngB required for normal cell division/ElaB/YqjD/DUF883 family membrane-anchored ribosome-binding protein
MTSLGGSSEAGASAPSIIHESYQENQQRLGAYIHRARSILDSIHGLTHATASHQLQYPLNTPEPAARSQPWVKPHAKNQHKKVATPSELVAPVTVPPPGAKSSSASTDPNSIPQQESSARIFNVLNLDTTTSHRSSLRIPANSLPQLLGDKLEEVKKHLCNLEARIQDPTCRILVTGDLNAGKSTFINALLRRNLLPVDQQPLTNVFTEVLEARHNEHAPGTEEVHACTELNEDADKSEAGFTLYPLTGLYDLVSSEDSPFHLLKVYCTQQPQTSVLVGNDLVDVCLIDTPGLNRDVWQTMALYAQQQEIDVIIFVVSSENHFTLSSKEFLMKAHQEKAYIFIIINKFDSIRDKQRCQKIILQQIQELSPQTFELKNKLVHFISSEAMVRGTEVEQFLHVEQALREFTLEKRSVSKLLPAKRYLQHLLVDMESLMDYNLDLAQDEMRGLKKALAALQPRESQLSDQKQSMLIELQEAIAQACDQAEHQVFALMTKLSGRLEESGALVPWRGIRNSLDYAREVYAMLQRTVERDMESCQIHAQESIRRAWGEMSRAHVVWYQEATRAAGLRSSTGNTPVDPNSKLAALVLASAPVTSLYPISFALTIRGVLFPMHARPRSTLSRNAVGLQNFEVSWAYFGTASRAMVDSLRSWALEFSPYSLALRFHQSFAAFSPGASVISVLVTGCSLVSSSLMLPTRSLGPDLFSLGLRVGVRRASKVAFFGAVVFGAFSGYHYMATLPSHLPSAMSRALVAHLQAQRYPETIAGHLRGAARVALAHAMADAGAKMDAAIVTVRARHQKLVEDVSRVSTAVDDFEELKSRSTLLQEEVAGVHVEDALHSEEDEESASEVTV